MRTWITRALAISIGAGVVAAQARPDFSGNWVMDLARTREANTARGASGGADSGAGATAGGSASMAARGGGATMAGGGTMAGAAPAVQEVKITQTADSLRVERVSGQAFAKVVYKLDGTESVSVNGQSTMKLKSRWEKTRLVSEGSSETALSDGSGSLRSTVRETRWIDKDGVMVVESTRTLEDRPPNTSVRYFVKKPR